MKIDLFNVDKFVEINKCEPVTSPITFEKGNIPTEDGLLSYKIFGTVGSYDRKTIFSYIDLKKHFLHPLVYKTLVSLDRRFKKVIDGTETFAINDFGELVKDENGETGLEWLYRRFNDLNFRQTDSRRRANKIGLLAVLDIDEIFVTKQLVIPAYYRDINYENIASGKISSNDINKLYTTLLSLTSSSATFTFMSYLTDSRIQNTLVEIYEYFTDSLKSKTGLIKDSLLSKTVDYSTRAVISANRVNQSKPADLTIPFTYIGLPLSHVCNLFFPFFVFQIQSWAEEAFLTTKGVIEYNKEEFKLINPMQHFTNSKIEDMLNRFIKSPESRLDLIKMEGKSLETGKVKTVAFNIYKNELYRPFTVLDLVFIVAHKIVPDKHVYVTRYPVENYQSIFPARIKIMTVYETATVTFGSKYFKDYPALTAEGIDDPSKIKWKFKSTSL